MDTRYKWIENALAGDSDCDGDVDLADYGVLASCITGPGGGPPGPACAVFDVEPDGDVDLVDYAAFARCLPETR